jgi:arylsulfatase A-like enzyme
VLFIVIDTLRWDRVGCYGAARNLTPAADALAKEGIRFDLAYATAPWTIPSVASMLTGLYPSRHNLIGFDRRFPEDLVTLPEILRRQGYATAGIISNLAVGSKRGFGKGFEVYLESEVGDPHYVSTAGVTRQATAQLEKLARGDRPFFLFVLYFDPHYSYIRHPEFGFASKPARRVTGKEPILKLRRMAADMTPEEAQYLRDVYDEEVAFTDAGVDRLLERLNDLGLQEETIVIFTSDHGEEFLDHGFVGHLRTLYEELIRVPFIVRLPDGPQAAVVKHPVSLVSLAPTVLDLVGIDSSPYEFQGASLKPLLMGEEVGESEEIFAEIDFTPLRDSWRDVTTNKKAIIVDRMKLIRDHLDNRTEVFDLEADPLETEDLTASRPALIPQLEQSLARAAEFAATRAVKAEPAPLSQDEIEMLKSLGYLGN